MKKRIVIFDLDGTLLNTIGDLGASCNYVMRRHDFPEHDHAAYCKMVGGGIRKLVQRAMPQQQAFDDEFIDAVTKEFADYYSRHIDLLTKPYDGINELLDELVRRGITVAVASNKFDSGTKHLIAEFFPHIKFAEVIGQCEGVPVKPDPSIVNNLLAKCNVRDRGSVLYVGDSGTDMQTAANASIESVGVEWGFRGREELQAAGADHIICHPSEILGLL